ncbi:MAG: ATP synthase F0F1 subunit delta [Peptococcaceae bacterium BICA1-7]|nr:MAG: ATP synthase F0F1 subunit delta [Peptococcaceae bacterium BICA1-7]
MLKGAVGSRYAEALYTIAEREKSVEVIEQELIAVDAVVRDNRDLQKVLYHPRITSEDKKSLLSELLSGKVSQVTLEFLNLLVDRQREQFLSVIVEYYINLANKARNITEAKVTSAVELTAKEQKEMAALLDKITGKKVETSFSVDPSLIGGVVVRIGDRVIDGSIRTRLATLREHLRQIS